MGEGAKYLVAVCRERTASPCVARSGVTGRLRVGARSEARTPACRPAETCIDAIECMTDLDPLTEL